MITIKRIGIPKDTVLRRYNLVDLGKNMLIACSHPIPDSSLCQDCRIYLIAHAEEIKYDWEA